MTKNEQIENMIGNYFNGDAANLYHFERLHLDDIESKVEMWDDVYFDKNIIEFMAKRFAEYETNKKTKGDEVKTLKDLEAAHALANENVLLINHALELAQISGNAALIDSLQDAELLASREYDATRKAVADFKREALPKKIKRIDDARFEIFKAMEIMAEKGSINDYQRGIVSCALNILHNEFNAEILTPA